MHSFFHPEIDTDIVILSEEESNHAARILRLKEKDLVKLIDGKGSQAIAEIKRVHHKQLELSVIERTTTQKRNFSIHIAIAPTKSFERTEWFIEKAVEAGIEQISFIQVSHSERKDINIERCEKIVIAALKQSGQLFKPVLTPLKKLADFCKSSEEDQKFIAWCKTPETELLKNKIEAGKNVVILIGPEGDFTEEEISIALANNFKEVSLGESRLRTETAALLSCFAVNLINQ